MNLINRIFSKKIEARADNYDRYFERLSGVSGVSSVHVNASTAESVSAVYACVAAISESVASLPLDVYLRTENGREKAKDHPLYDLLQHAPNDYQTALEFREMMQRHVLLRGNAYARISFDNLGRVVSLNPIHPDGVSVLKASSGSLVYEVTDDAGRVSRLSAEEVLHLRYHSDDGILGRSPIAVARDTIGLALAEQQHGANSFNNGTKLSGVLQTDQALTQQQLESVSRQWNARYAGTDNAAKTAILPNGLEFKPVSMTLEDAEWIEARRLSVEEVARLFRVPPVLIGDLREANYSNAVELGRYFVTHTLRRHLIAWEQALDRSVIADRTRFYCEHNVEGLLRGDSLNRAQFYQIAISSGWMTPDEVREKENLPKMDSNNATAQSSSDS